MVVCCLDVIVEEMIERDEFGGRGVEGVIYL